MTANSKDDLLRQMVDLAGKSGLIAHSSDILKCVVEREKVMSTGIGKGVALPHAKTNKLQQAVGSLALLATPINYDSLDGAPISICFLLLGRESNVGVHLRILSKVSRLLNDDSLRAKVLASKNESELYDLIISVEEE